MIGGLAFSNAAVEPPPHTTTAAAPITQKTFRVDGYELEGTSTLPPEQVREILNDAVGPAVPLSRIAPALRRLQDALRQSGLKDASVTLPRQASTSAVLRIRVASPGTIPPTSYEVRHWVIQGNTALSPEELDQLIGPDAGKALTVSQFRELMERLREAYRQRGYPEAAVRIPQQLLADGRVTIAVAEGEHRSLASPSPAALVVTPEQPPSPVTETQVPTFEVRRYAVTGNTILPSETVEAAFTNALGPTVSLAQIQKALGTLQLAYRERGYATVAVGLPQQQLTNATVKVEVTEGRLTDIRVTGNRHFSSNNIVRALPSLRTNTLLNSRVLQRELDIANQNRDRQIYPTLGPGPEPGTSAVTLRVQDRLPLHGRLEVNNLSTPGTPEWRINASAQYNNLWQREHQLGVSYGFSPEEFKTDGLFDDYLLNRPLIANLGAYYRLPFGEPESVANALTTSRGFGYDEATRQFRLPPAGGRPDLSFFASTSSSDTGVQYGPESVVSQTPLLTILSQDTGQNLSVNQSLGTRFNFPLPLSDTRRLSLSAGVDWKGYSLDSYNTNNFVIRTVVTNAQGSQVIESRVASPQPARSQDVQYLPLVLAADYSSTDAAGSLSANLTLGANVLGDDADFAALAYSRRAEALYGRANASINREQRLPQNWSLLLRASGQTATGPMISNEQFALGGAYSVRGYFEGDQYGDAGWLGSVELRSPFLQSRVPTASDFVPVWLRGSAFVDAGQAFVFDDEAYADSILTLLGLGFGVSANINNHIDLRIVVGWPVFDTPNTRSGEGKAYLSLGGQF